MTDYLEELIQRYPQLKVIKNNIFSAYQLLKETFEKHGKLLAAGNGGSAADADHIVGELMKGFVKKRHISSAIAEEIIKYTPPDTAEYLNRNLQQGLPALSLVTHNALNSACINDIDGKIIFANQILGFAKEHDTFLGISTSGNSENIYLAFAVSKALGLKTIALTGGTGGKAAELADVSIIVPEKETYKIQELHLPIYHTLCLMLEEHFF